MTNTNDNNTNNKPNVGYLFPNEKKNDKSPDWRGKLTVDGKEFWVSGWNKAKDSKQMITVTITEIPGDK